MNAKEYMEILKENQIIKSINERFGKFGCVFQQGGSSPFLGKLKIFENFLMVHAMAHSLKL